MSEVQEILFQRKYWNRTNALNWLKKHNYPYLKSKGTNYLFRFTIKDAIKYNKFWTKEDSKDNIIFIMGFKKRYR